MNESGQSLPDCLWFACHTKPRCEKKLDVLLDSLGWEHYLPLVSRKHRYGNRTRMNTLPLFPGYVFARVPMEQKARLYQQQLLARTLPILDEKTFLKQMADIRSLIAAGIELSLKSRLLPGTKVRICSGSFRGLEGIVKDPARRDDGIIIILDILQQGVHAKVPLEDIELL